MSTNIVGRENLPNVYIKQVNIEEMGQSLSVSSVVHLYDVPSGGWYQEENLRNNMKILVVLSSNQDFNQQIVTGRASLTPENLKFVNGYNKQEVHHKTFSISVANRKAFENQLANGHVAFPYKCSFKIQQAANLSVFAVCYLDTKQFSSENNLDLSTRNVSLYHGAVTGEQVLVSGKIPLESNMFTDTNGRQHIGPVYSNSGAFFAGSNISPSKQNQLNLVSTKNTKIKDYRMSFKQKRLNKVKTKKKPIFSELYASVDGHGTVRATFDIDMNNLYMQTSGYAKLLHALNKDIYDAAVDHLTITDLSIYSERIKEKVRTSQSGTKAIVPVSTGRRKKVISSKESKRGLQTVEQEFAKIQELDINLGKNQAIPTVERRRRTVCFSQANNRYTRGSIGYSLELSYKDPSEEIILNIVRDASIALSGLKNYKQRVERATNYNYHADQTKPNLYNGTGAGAWRNPVNQFMEMYTLMFDTTNVDLERLMSSLITMTHPRSLTIRSLSWFCERYSYMLSRMKKYFKKVIPSFTPDVKVGYVKTDMQKGKLLVKNKFKDLVDLKDYRTSVSFVPKSLSGDTPVENSFPILSYGSLRAMARGERLRFFSDNPAFTSQMVPYLKQDILDQLNNIDYNSYTFFSPTSITHGAKNRVDVSILEKVNLDEFNSVYNRTQSEKHRVGYSAISRRQQNIKAGRKSAFYIKESRRDPEDINEYKSSNENLGKESNFSISQNQKDRIDSPNLDRKTRNRFRSYERAKESDIAISFEEFNLRNQKNVLTETSSKNVADSDMKRIIRAIPLQLKALLGSEYGFAKNNIFYGHEDLLQETQVRDLVKTCFLSLIKIQYLEDYKDNNFKDANWRDMTSYSFNSLIVKRKKTVLCRIVPYNNATLRLESDLFDKFGIENKYFFISKGFELDNLRVKGRRVRNGGQIVVDRRSINDTVNSFIGSFLEGSILNTKKSDLGCNSLVVNQPASKNGPLQQVDYGVVNDLVGARSTTTTTATPTATAMPISTTANSGGSY